MKITERVSNYVKMIGDENKRLSLLVENICKRPSLIKTAEAEDPGIDIHNLIEQTITNIKLQWRKEGEITPNAGAIL